MATRKMKGRRTCEKIARAQSYRTNARPSRPPTFDGGSRLAGAEVREVLP